MFLLISNKRLPNWFRETLGIRVIVLNHCNYCVEHHFTGLSSCPAVSERRLSLTADAIRAGRCRESLSLPGGIVEIGCLYSHLLWLLLGVMIVTVILINLTGILDSSDATLFFDKGALDDIFVVIVLTGFGKSHGIEYPGQVFKHRRATTEHKSIAFNA